MPARHILEILNLQLSLFWPNWLKIFEEQGKLGSSLGYNHSYNISKLRHISIQIRSQNLCNLRPYFSFFSKLFSRFSLIFSMFSLPFMNLCVENVKFALLLVMLKNIHISIYRYQLKKNQFTFGNGTPEVRIFS